MTVKDCIIEALRYLGLSAQIEKINNNETDAEINSLFCMAKNVIEEICCDYYPLKVTKVVTFNGGKLLLSSLTSPIDIFELKVGGESCPFKVFFDRIEADVSGAAQLTYSYAPVINSLEVVLPFGQRLSARLIGCGIACEYCVINGMAEALTFDKKYRDGLKKAVVQKHEKRVKARQWA